jgi:hypothetical protein
MVEAAFGTFLKPAATAGSGSTPKQGQFLTLKSQMSVKRNRANRADKRLTRSQQERITRQKEVTWMADAYLLPPEVGDTNRCPDVAAFLRQAMGVQTLTANTSAAYTLSASQSARGSLSIVREDESIFMEAVSGAWVDEMKISLQQGEEPKISFSGMAKSYIPTRYTTLNAQAIDTATSIDVVNGRELANGSVVQVGTSNGGGVGHTLSAKTLVSGVNYTFTVTPAISGLQAIASAIIPYVPSMTLNGSPIAGIEGSCTVVDSGGSPVSVEIDALEVSLKNNDKAVYVAFQEECVDYIPGIRDVSGSITLRLTRSQMDRLGARDALVLQDIRAIFGSTTLLKCQIDLKAEYEFEPVDLPESDEGKIKLPFVGLSAAGEGELIVTIN